MKKLKIYLATQGQIAKIHIAKKELHIDDESYRQQLAVYINVFTNLPVKHANELAMYQAEELLEKYKSAGWIQPEPQKGKNEKWSKNKGRKKYEELASRSEEWPSPGQLRLIEFTWRVYSKDKTDGSLQKFLAHKYGLADLTWVKKDQVQKIVKAIKSL